MTEIASPRPILANIIAIKMASTIFEPRYMAYTRKAMMTEYTVLGHKEILVRLTDRPLRPWPRRHQSWQTCLPQRLHKYVSANSNSR